MWLKEVWFIRLTPEQHRADQHGSTQTRIVFISTHTVGPWYFQPPAGNPQTWKADCMHGSVSFSIWDLTIHGFPYVWGSWTPNPLRPNVILRLLTARGGSAPWCSKVNCIVKAERVGLAGGVEVSGTFRHRDHATSGQLLAAANKNRSHHFPWPAGTTQTLYTYLFVY